MKALGGAFTIVLLRLCGRDKIRYIDAAGIILPVAPALRLQLPSQAYSDEREQWTC